MKNRNTGIVLSYVNTVLNMILGLFMSTFLLRRLGDTDYGIYQTVSSFVNYLVLLEFGTGAIMVRNISLCRSRNVSKEELERNISTIWSIGNMLAALILVVSVIFYFSIDRIYSVSLLPEQITYAKNIFVFAAANLIISFLWQTLKSVALGFEDYTFSSKLSIIKLLLRTVLLVALLMPFKSSIVVAIVDAFLSFAIFVYTYAYCVRRFKVKINFSSFDSLILKSMLPLCLAVFLQAIMTQANNNVAKFVIGILMNPETVSLYSVGLYIFSVCNSITYLPAGIYAPQTAKVVTQSGSDGAKMTDFMVQPARLILIVGGSIVFGFIAAGKPFINLVYGSQYIQAWLVAILLMLPLVFIGPSSLVENILNVLNKRLVRSIILVGTTVINIFLTIFFIGKFGVVGAAFSTGFCNFLGLAILSNIYYVKAIKIKIFHLYRMCYKGILLYQIFGAVFGYWISVSIPNQVVAFLAGGCLYVLIAFGGFILFGMNESEKQMLKATVTRLRRKNR